MKRPNSRIFSSEFYKNILTLTSGTALAQIIPFCLAPVLSRIYTPEDFGILALFLSVSQVLGAISTGRYELAILIPKSENESVQLAIIAIIIAFVVSVFTLIIIIFFSNDIASLLGDRAVGKWLYLIPFTVFMQGCFNSLNYYNTRLKNYGTIAKANVIKSAGGNSLQIVFGLLKKESGGLIIGQVFSHLFGNVKLLKSFYNKKNVIKSFSRKDLLSTAIKYIDFPRYSMWGIFINLVSLNLTNLIVARYFGVFQLGQFAHSYKYLGVPLVLIGNSFSQVYFQKLSLIKNNNTKDAIPLFKKTVSDLFVISLAIFIPAFFLVEDLFVFVFGEPWRIAGIYAKLLMPVMAVRFVVTPVATTLSAFELQSKEFLVHIVLLASTIISWGVSFVLEMKIEQSILFYSLFLTGAYFLILIYVYKLIIIKVKNSIY